MSTTTTNGAKNRVIKIKKQCFLCGDNLPTNLKKLCKKCNINKKQNREPKENATQCGRCKIYKEEQEFTKCILYKQCTECRNKHNDYHNTKNLNKKCAAVEEEEGEAEEGEEEHPKERKITPKKKYNILDYKDVILKIKKLYNIQDDINTIYKNIEAKEEEEEQAEEIEESNI
jgi:hypothetical protein